MQYIKQKSTLVLRGMKQLPQALSHALCEGLVHILTCARTDSAGCFRHLHLLVSAVSTSRSKGSLFSPQKQYFL